MGALSRLWTRIVRIAKVLEGMDDPRGDYVFSLGKRVDKLERDVAYLERQRDSNPAERRRASNTI